MSADNLAPEPTSAPDLGSQYLVPQIRGRVLHLRVDRAERRNAFTQDMYRGLKRAAIWADEQPWLDAVCLTGTDRWFGAGGDMGGRAEDREGLATEWDPTDHFPFRHIERCSKLWVAKVNGLCIAGGMDLILHCDVVIASDRARFRVPELLRGIPDAAMSSRLAAVVGLNRARYLYFTAEEFDAAEAAAMGLVGKVVPHDDLDAATDRALAAIGLTGPRARAAVKRDMNQRLPVADQEMFRRSIGTPEMVEGMRAFLEKREVDWPRG
ncbi:enoyl-CoA hydratase/isomerase family protein [Yinghuangia sp. YIM S09857]|uniref:enoyl-CoA hydratase/isomerase family protein n=1 Tax=Yinghuangia sp. YIM S09857 TaxID=3436929 RepID=UPI003F52F09A